MQFAILVCFLSALALLLLLRRGKLSLGLPLALLLLLLLEHVPGAWAASQSQLMRGDAVAVEVGIQLTALATVAFVGGVWWALATIRQRGPARRPDRSVPRKFLIFCLLGGWTLTFVVSKVINIPSVNAVVHKGGAVWILAIMLGLTTAAAKKSVPRIVIWLLALLVYPSVALVVGGFMSYGAMSLIIALSILTIYTKRVFPVLIGMLFAGVLGISLFVNYFEIRDELREAAWGGASLQESAGVASKISSDFELLDPDNPAHLDALRQRLNQNLFVGLAAERLSRGEAEYLYGRSLYEALISLVPRAVWPNKPVFGGSGRIVPEMTGLRLSKNAAWGVGSVMEFYINFAWPGVVAGFALLGFAVGRLDQFAARSLAARNYIGSLRYFLPGIALIQPLGSMVELASGAAAAYFAAIAWGVLWRHAFAPGAVTPARRYAAFAPSDDGVGRRRGSSSRGGHEFPS